MISQEQLLQIEVHMRDLATGHAWHLEKGPNGWSVAITFGFRTVVYMSENFRLAGDAVAGFLANADEITGGINANFDHGSPMVVGHTTDQSKEG